MKFLPLGDLAIVTRALNFDTPDCHVSGSCDLYTTKAAGSDKKLYKTIDKSLETQQASLHRLGAASLSPPDREKMVASMNLSRSSPFGPLTEMSSRRTYAYLIATLNASHSDYDFSHVLRPGDFRLEGSLGRVIGVIDSTLTNVRAPALNGSIPRSYGVGDYWSSTASVGASASAAAEGYESSFAQSGMGASSFADEGDGTGPTWGPNMWAKIDKEMDLKSCQVYSYQPADDPFEEDEEHAVWSFHYLFFSKVRKRVVYLYARGVAVVSHRVDFRVRGRRGSHSYSPYAHSLGGVVGGSLGRHGGLGTVGQGWWGTDSGGDKRARYWLGDRVVDQGGYSGSFDSGLKGGDGMDIEEDGGDDNILWNRGDDGEVENPNEYCSSEYDSCDMDDEEDGDRDEDVEVGGRGYGYGVSDGLGIGGNVKGGRAGSEDVAGRMELD